MRKKVRRKIIEISKIIRGKVKERWRGVEIK